MFGFIKLGGNDVCDIYLTGVPICAYRINGMSEYASQYVSADLSDKRYRSFTGRSLEYVEVASRLLESGFAPTADSPNIVPVRDYDALHVSGPCHSRSGYRSPRLAIDKFSQLRTSGISIKYLDRLVPVVDRLLSNPPGDRKLSLAHMTEVAFSRLLISVKDPDRFVENISYLNDLLGPVLTSIALVSLTGHSRAGVDSNDPTTIELHNIKDLPNGKFVYDVARYGVDPAVKLPAVNDTTVSYVDLPVSVADFAIQLNMVANTMMGTLTPTNTLFLMANSQVVEKAIQPVSAYISDMIPESDDLFNLAKLLTRADYMMVRSRRWELIASTDSGLHLYGSAVVIRDGDNFYVNDRRVTPRQVADVLGVYDPSHYVAKHGMISDGFYWKTRFVSKHKVTLTPPLPDRFDLAPVGYAGSRTPDYLGIRRDSVKPALIELAAHFGITYKGKTIERLARDIRDYLLKSGYLPPLMLSSRIGIYPRTGNYTVYSTDPHGLSAGYENGVNTAHPLLQVEGVTTVMDPFMKNSNNVYRVLGESRLSERLVLSAIINELLMREITDVTGISDYKTNDADNVAGLAEAPRKIFYEIPDMETPVDAIIRCVPL